MESLKHYSYVKEDLLRKEQLIRELNAKLAEAKDRVSVQPVNDSIIKKREPLD